MKNSTPQTAQSAADKDHGWTPGERRSHDRQIAMLRLAKIRTGSREGWGFIRNLSAKGMMLEIHPDFNLGETVSALLTEDQELTGKVKWRKGASVGIEFDHAIDIAGLLHKSSETKNGRLSRMPRIQMKHPVDVLVGSRNVGGDMCDISPTGMCIKTSHTFETGKRVRIRVADLLDIKGKVRWQSLDRVGLAFDERLPLDRLMSWLSASYAAETFEDIVASSSSGAVNIEARTELDPPDGAYNIFAYNDVGEAIMIASMDTAEKALIQYKAALQFFSRVMITNADQAELSVGPVGQRIVDKDQVPTNFS